ncbi:MAG: FAD-dependent oxidoreductase [Elusimicrobiota bacterium]
MAKKARKETSAPPARAGVVILGAGLTGLVAARELLRAGRRDVLLLERDARPGGLLKTNRDGVTIDELPHLFFGGNARAEKLFRRMAGPVREFRHRLGVMWKGGWVDFPFQDHISQLSLEDRRAVLRSLLERRGGPGAAAPRDLGEYALNELGSGIVDLFFRPYNEKLWQTPLAGMGYDWMAAKIRLPGPSGLADSILGIKDGGRPAPAPHASFIYPRRGGIESLIEGLLADLEPLRPLCGVEALSIDPAEKEIRTSAGTVRYDRIISTLPLDRAVRMAGLKECYPAAGRLRATKVACFHYALRSVNLPPYHWIYVPDPALPFYRLTREDLLNPRAVPGGKALIVECALPPGGSVAGLERKVTDGLVRSGVIRRRDILKTWLYPHFPAYPVPHVRHGEDVPFCLGRLASAGMISAGRFGEWSVYNMDHSIEAGIAAAGKALS